MKVGLIYTSTTPELIELVEQEVKKQLGDDVELYSLQDPSILADVRAAGYVTTAPAARLIGMYMKAAEEGVDAMLNLCSSVGEVADSAQPVTVTLLVNDAQAELLALYERTGNIHFVLEFRGDASTAQKYLDAQAAYLDKAGD